MVYASRLVAVVVIVAVAWAIALLHLFALRRGAPARPVWLKRLGWATAVMALLSALAMIWAHVEPYWPEVTRTRIESPKVKGPRPIRIVQLSDLHSDGGARLEERIPELVAAEQPDAIVFTGDATNSRDGLPVFRECMRRLVAIAPVFAVAGNWEAWWQSDFDHYRGTGVTVLDGDARPLRASNDEIWIAGTAVEHEDRIGEALRRVPEGSFAILLHHFPMAWRSGEAGGADLVLSGDTHGGQLRLPIIGSLIRIVREDGVYYEPGLQEPGRTPLYVHRGIGMEGGVPRVRLGCRPEIAVIEIAPAPR